MAVVKHDVYLCDKDFKKLAKLQYQNLQYSDVINAVPQCYFEMQIQNKVFNDVDFDFTAGTFNILVERDGIARFKGELDEIRPADTKASTNDALLAMDRLGLYASGKLGHLSRMLANSDANSTEYKRSFDNVGLGTAARTLMEEAIARTNSLVSDCSIGTIENPVNELGEELKLTLDQHFYALDTLTWIDILAVWGDADYWLDQDNKFHFVKNKGINRDNSLFRLKQGQPGNNLSSVRLETSKTTIFNRVLVLGAGEGSLKKFADVSDTNHIQKYGLKETVIAARELDTEATANEYAKNKLEELKSASKYVVFTPTLSHDPLQGFDIGDVVRVDIDWFIFNFVKRLRVVGLTTYVTQEDTEFHSYSLTEPKLKKG